MPSLIRCLDLLYFIAVSTLFCLGENEQGLLKQIQGTSTSEGKSETFSPTKEKGLRCPKGPSRKIALVR